MLIVEMGKLESTAGHIKIMLVIEITGAILDLWPK